MQTTLITYLPVTTNGVEPASEVVTTGQGMRISAAARPQTSESLFTTILQKGIAVTAPLNTATGLGNGEIPIIAGTDEANDSSGDQPEDICSLMMQMLVLQSGGTTCAGSNETSEEKTAGGVRGVINEIAVGTDAAASTGLTHAAAVILQNDGKAAEVLSAMAFTKPGAGNGGQTEGDQAAPFNSVLAGISDAIRNELMQKDANQTTPTVGETSASSAASATVVSETSVRDLAATVSAGKKTTISESSTDGITQDNESVVSSNSPAEKMNPATTPADIANGDDAGGSKNEESSFAGLLSKDKKKDSQTSAAENGGASQIVSSLKSETAAEKTSAVERALNKFTDDLRSITGGNQEIQIVLEPESLGVLTISVIKTESGISAKIKAEDREVAAIISDHVQKLISSMESKGITVSDVDVVYSQTEQNTGGFTQQGFSQARDESSRGYTPQPERNAEEDTANPEVWQTLYGGENSGDMTVEYRV